MATDITISSEGKVKMYFTLGLFIVILLISIITYIYSNNIKADQINLKSEILSLQTDIETLKTSKEVTVYNLIELNESYIASLDKISDINNVVTNIVSIEEKFGLVFSNFHYRGGEVLLEGFSPLSDGTLSYSKVSDFISHFRGENNEIFNLGHVSNFNGRDSLKFNVKFNLK